MENGLTHFDNDGKAVMVDVSQKEITARRAEATGSIRVNRQVMDAILQGTVKKGDVLGVARIAGIMAVKKTQELIPLCHTLPLDGCSIDFHCREEDLTVDAVCSAWNHGRTGVEMEALTGVSMTMFLNPAESSSFVMEMAAAPAPEVTTLTSSFFLPTTFSAFVRPARVMMAVPC